MILDGTFLRKLEQLSLVARRVRAGQVAGERRSTRRGASVEFADYRDYAQGDDLRRVDWNIYARLERPFVKLFEEEEDLAVHLLLDGSGSMDWGEGSRQVDEETRKQVDKETSRQGNKGRSLPLSPPMGRPLPSSPPMGGALPSSPPMGGALPSSPPMGGALPSSPPMGGSLPLSPPMGGALPLSPPMGGTEGGDENKWLYARRLAAALGYVALVTGDRLTIANLQSPISNLQPPISNLQFDPVRGRGHALRLFEWLEGLKAGGATDLNASLRGYAISGGRPGLVVLVSDLFSPLYSEGSFSPLYSEGSKAAPIHSEGSEAAPTGYVEGLTRLAARGHEIAVIHVLAPDEVEPPLGGDLRLLDVETGEPQEVTVDARMRTLYRRRLAAWRDEIRATCRARDVHYVPVETDVPFERVVLYDLRRAGLLR